MNSIKKIQTISVFVILVFFMAGNAVFAQELKRWRMGVGGGLGPAWQGDNLKSGGLVGTLQPSFRLGRRYELNIRFEGVINDQVSTNSYGIMFKYYVSKINRGFFVSAGPGFFRPHIHSSVFGGLLPEAVTTSRSEQRVPGICAAVGYDFRHMSFVFENNTASSSNAQIYGGNEWSPGKISNSYFCLKFLFFFGGGGK